MRFKNPLTQTPGLILEKSERRILHAADAIRTTVTRVLKEGAEAFLKAEIERYEREEIADAAVKSGAIHHRLPHPVVDSTVPAGRPVTKGGTK